MSLAVEGSAFGRVRVPQWFDGAVSLAEAVQRAVHARLIEQANDVWSRGGAIDFGPLAVARDGVRRGAKHLPWAAVEHVAIDGGWVRIRARGKVLPLATLGRDRVPNALVLRESATRAMAR